MEEKSYRADQNHTKKPAAYGWLFVSEAWGNLSILQGNHHLMHD
ncbi:hypothetical protein [Enterobacter hormaechei]|nr:hypothetical protein [Enterobacter hormaechei]